MFRVGLLTLVLSSAAIAQQNVPGTFQSAATQPAITSNQPLISTPTMTLSNGFTPATVTMQQTLPAEQPTTMVSSSEAMPQGEGVAIATTALPSDAETAPASDGSVFDTGATGSNVADVARQSKKYSVDPHKTYTNDDVDRMNSATPDNGVISATFANGQPIVARNEGGFSPESGIANMPDAAQADGTELANAPANPMGEGDATATASNADQGQSDTQQATMPSAAPAPNGQPANQQLPASDNPQH